MNVFVGQSITRHLMATNHDVSVSPQPPGPVTGTSSDPAVATVAPPPPSWPPALDIVVTFRAAGTVTTTYTIPGPGGPLSVSESFTVYPVTSVPDGLRVA